MTVEEVEAAVTSFASSVPEALATAIQNITVHTARDRNDVAVIKAAILDAGVVPADIPSNFRAVYLGEQLDQLAAAADDVEEVVDSIRGAIVLNASMLLSPQDVYDTLLHEIAHALGYDEDEVAMLGLE